MSGADPLAAVRNLAAKAWRRVAAIPKRGLRLTRRAERIREQAAVFQAEWEIERELARIAHGRQPVIVGPWLSEVGFEVLYWVPFLRWFEDRFRVDRRRVVAISRGGVGDWYGDIAERYVEIFDHLDPAVFARRNAERREHGEGGGQKQTNRSPLDDELIAIASGTAGSGARGPTVCHPSLMYRLFGQFWLGNRASDLVSSRTRHAAVNAAAHGLPLPDRYVAVKFYTGTALPDTPDSRQALRDIVSAIADRLPVVVLDTGMATDEHEDYLFRGIPNVMSLRDRLEPRTNLGVQTSVVAGAEAFVGTCGSLAWLAPMLGVDTVAVYADDRLLLSHLYFAGQAYRTMNAARFDALDLRAVTHLNLLEAAAGADLAS